MQIIKNNHLKITAKKAGAELTSLQKITTNQEYLWQANPTYWGRQAPVLFPIVGKLKDDTYYLGKMLTSSDEVQVAAAEKVKIFWPNQEDRGSHVNISGAALTKSSKNLAQAIQLLEFLVSDDAQQWYAEKNLEYPIKPGIQASEILQSWGEFKADDISLDQLGERNAEAVMIMDRAKWK